MAYQWEKAIHLIHVVEIIKQPSTLVSTQELVGQILPASCYIQALLEFSYAHMFMGYLWLLFHYNGRVE